MEILNQASSINAFIEPFIVGKHNVLLIRPIINICIYMGPSTYYVTLILAFLDIHLPSVTLCHEFKITHPPPMCDITLCVFNWVFFSVFTIKCLLCFLASKWHQNRIARLILEVKPNFIYERARLAIMKQNMLNIKLFKKYDISLQKQPTHPLSHFVIKIKGPSLHDIILNGP